MCVCVMHGDDGLKEGTPMQNKSKDLPSVWPSIEPIVLLGCGLHCLVTMVPQNTTWVSP